MSAICYSDYSFITNCEDRIKTANRCNACAANVILESEQYCFYDSAYANDNKWTDLYKKTLERYIHVIANHTKTHTTRSHGIVTIKLLIIDSLF